MHPVRTVSLEGPWWDLRLYLAPEHIQEHTLETACPEWVYTQVLRELQIETFASHTALKKRGRFQVSSRSWCPEAYLMFTKSEVDPLAACGF